MRPPIFILLLSLAPALAVADEPASAKQTPQKLTAQTDVSLDYLLYLPENYAEQEKWPLVVFLHGSGERGSDLEKVKIHGPPKLVAAGKKFPFILVSPQCPANERWQTVVLDALLTDLEKRLKVDSHRIYLTGLSMGGQGVWMWAARSPQRFAAIAPVCGRSDRGAGKVLAKVPAWVFHGAKDTAVPLKQSEQIVSVIRKHGGDPKFTIYPEAGHDSWTETYNNPALYEWLLKHTNVRKHSSGN